MNSPIFKNVNSELKKRAYLIQRFNILTGLGYKIPEREKLEIRKYEP